MNNTNKKTVPEKMRERFEAIMGIVDPFCQRHLNAEYAALCRRMAAAMCRKRPSPLSSGATQVWACAIVYAAGKVNFLFDNNQKPHLSASDLCRLMEVSQASASAKSGRILGALDSMPLDPRWSLPSRLDDNPPGAHSASSRPDPMIGSDQHVNRAAHGDALDGVSRRPPLPPSAGTARAARPLDSQDCDGDLSGLG